MPVTQVAPPGFLDQHGVLVALTPVLGCLLGALALRIIGEPAPGTRGWSALRVLAGLHLLGMLALQALFLLPWGAATAYDERLAGGLLRVGWLASGTALACGAWALWYWSPLRSGGSVVGWCLRTALALALPVLVLPALVIAALADDARASARRCFVVGGVAVLASAALLLVPGLAREGETIMRVVLLLAIWAGGGPWRWVMAGALLAGGLAP